MKHIAILALLILATAGQGQQPLTPAQVIPCPSSDIPYLAVVLQNPAPGTRVTFQCVKLDGFFLDQTATPPTIRFPLPSLLIPSFIDAETPAGVIDGTGNLFTLANAPNPPESLQLFRNGVLQAKGTGYTIGTDGQSLTVIPSPQVGEALTAYYRLLMSTTEVTFGP
jgi:hypothetical protein